MGGYHTPQTAQYSVTWSGADGVNTRVDGPSNILEANAVISAGDISITETNSTFDMTLATTNATSNNKAIVAASWDA
jgi:fructose-specific phosphotransferase system component IIB